MLGGIDAVLAAGEHRNAGRKPEADRHRLLNGLDTIAETLLDEAAIRRHEQHTPAWVTPQPAGA